MTTITNHRAVGASDQKLHSKRTSCRTLVATLAMMLFGAIFASTASAGCADVPAKPSQQRIWLVQAAYRPGSFMLASDDDNNGPSIVGFWKFTFVAKGNGGNPFPFNPPDGVILDAGFVQWHSDGTEIMNSGRDPATSSFCMGVWKSTGKFKYKLNHFALSWDATGKDCPPSQQPGATGCFQGPANIREEIILDRSTNHYTGIVTIDQYDPTGTTLQFELKGTVAADRITPD
jgi:hypothetical protein